jgi:hypothetical protein
VYPHAKAACLGLQLPAGLGQPLCIGRHLHLHPTPPASPSWATALGTTTYPTPSLFPTVYPTSCKGVLQSSVGLVARA